MKPISRNKCPEHLRSDFLPNAVGKYFFRYEQLTFAFMAQACESYQGGYWDFYSLSNGGFYMSLQSDERLRLVWPDNYFDGAMSADAASIGVNLMAQSALAWETRADRFADTYHALRDYAGQHEQAGLILDFID